MQLSKKNLLITLSLLVSFSALAQNMMTDEVTNNMYLSSKTTPVFKGYKNLQGSVYANKEFQNGSVFKDGKVVANNVGLRYNVQKEEIELLNSVNSPATVANVIKATESVHVRILNNVYVYLISNDENVRDGYYQVMEEGEKLTVYKKITKQYVEGKKSINSVARDIPDMYKQKEQYFVAVKNEGLKKLPKGKSKRKKLFTAKENEMKTFIDSKKLNLRKNADFYQAIAHYNTL